MTYYKEHGIRPEAVGIQLPVDTLKITRQLHLRQVADLTEAPLEDLKNLNPQYTHEIIPGGKEYILRIPYKYTNTFIEYEDSVYRHKIDEYFNPAAIKKIKEGGDGERITYKVKSGDTLGKIAGKYRCTVAQIKRWNNLKSNNIRIGQRLVVYRGGKSSSTSSVSSSTSAPAGTSAVNTTGGGTYTVKSGDTLSAIAARHGITLANLKAWNGLSSNNIKVGQKLKGSDTSVTRDTSVSNNSDYTVYTVKSGDSFYSISKNYPGVSAENIMDFNGLTSSKLKPGMQIKIPKK
jgi:membrane-bound lytic murein transglycosylase D